MAANDFSFAPVRRPGIAGASYAPYNTNNTISALAGNRRNDVVMTETPSQNLAAKAVIDLQQPNTGLLTQLMLSNESRKELLAIFCAIDQNPRDGIISYSDLQNYTQGLTVWKEFEACFDFDENQCIQFTEFLQGMRNRSLSRHVGRLDFDTNRSFTDWFLYFEQYANASISSECAELYNKLKSAGIIENQKGVLAGFNLSLTVNSLPEQLKNDMKEKQTGLVKAIEIELDVKEKIVAVFALLDNNGDGVLSNSDFQNSLGQLQTWKFLRSHFDLDGDKTIEIKEFIVGCVGMALALQPQEITICTDWSLDQWIGYFSARVNEAMRKVIVDLIEHIGNNN